MRVWLEKTLTGLRAADDESAQVLSSIKLGTTFEADVKTRKPRSTAWHRRYWLLMSLIAGNVEAIDIGLGVQLPVKDAEDVHLAMKFLTGHTEKYTATHKGKTVLIRIPKRTAFEKMSADEWAAYYPKVLDAVHQHILPTVEIPDIEQQIAELAS